MSRAAGGSRFQMGCFAAANNTMFCLYHHSTFGSSQIFGRIRSADLYPWRRKCLHQYERCCSLM